MHRESRIGEIPADREVVVRGRLLSRRHGRTARRAADDVLERRLAAIRLDTAA